MCDLIIQLYNSLPKNLYVVIISNTTLLNRMFDDMLPPLEIFCPFCQPNLWYYLLFPQTAERKMKQVVYGADDGTISVAYSCEGCLEMYFERRDGVCEIEPVQDEDTGVTLPPDYRQYIKRTFGDFKLVHER